MEEGWAPRFRSLHCSAGGCGRRVSATARTAHSEARCEVRALRFRAGFTLYVVTIIEIYSVKPDLPVPPARRPSTVKSFGLVSEVLPNRGPLESPRRHGP